MYFNSGFRANANFARTYAMCEFNIVSQMAHFKGNFSS